MKSVETENMPDQKIPRHCYRAEFPERNEVDDIGESINLGEDDGVANDEVHYSV